MVPQQVVPASDETKEATAADKKTQETQTLVCAVLKRLQRDPLRLGVVDSCGACVIYYTQDITRDKDKKVQDIFCRISWKREQLVQKEQPHEFGHVYLPQPAW